MAENLPIGLTFEHAERLAAVIEDARTRATHQLLDGGYSPEVIDREMAFVFARCAARHGLDVAEIAKTRNETLEAMNRALAEELRETKIQLSNARGRLIVYERPAKKPRANGKRIR